MQIYYLNSIKKIKKAFSNYAKKKNEKINKLKSGNKLKFPQIVFFILVFLIFINSKIKIIKLNCNLISRKAKTIIILMQII